MSRDRLNGLSLDGGHFLDHLFMLVFATVRLAEEWEMSYAALIPYATPGFVAFGIRVVPREASVMCAAGQLLSDRRHDFVKSFVMSLDRLDRDTVERHYQELRPAAEEALLAGGVPDHRIAVSCAADVGQFSGVDAPMPDTVSMEAAVASFQAQGNAPLVGHGLGPSIA